MSMCRAPSSNARATVCRWSAREVLVRSKCAWFWPVFGSSVGAKRIRKPVSSPGRSMTESAGSRPRSRDQNRINRSGWFAAKQTATRCRVTTAFYSAGGRVRTPFPTRFESPATHEYVAPVELSVGDGSVLDRSRFVLEFEEDFGRPSLAPERWVAHYLPQWTTPDRSAARYDLRPGRLRLRIDADQPAWRAEDGEMRVSNLQTGTFSGPAGSPRGQHRHRPDLAVRSPQPTRRLYTPSSGLAEAV